MQDDKEFIRCCDFLLSHIFVKSLWGRVVEFIVLKLAMKVIVNELKI